MIEMKLFIAGGGNEKDSVELDRTFVSVLDKNKSLAYIPVAMTSRPYEECYSWFRSVFNPLGVKKMEMWTDLRNIIPETLEEISGIYIGGGDTSKLLKEVRESGFEKILHDYIDRNNPVYGGSAGAIILGKSIKTSREFVDTGDSMGLDLLSGYSVYAHYRKSDDLEKLSSMGITKVIAIPERSGLIVEGKKIRVLGFEPVYLINSESSSTIYPNQESRL